MSANSKTLNGHESATTALRQKHPSNPKPSPATQPQTSRLNLFSAPERFTNPDIFSAAKNPIRDTISAIRPQVKAPAKAEATLSRQAMFEKGISLMKIQPYNAQRGCPDGMDGLGYIAAVEKTPEYSRVTSGARVGK